MYTGNGVTKKFPLPDGYDGSAVYLIFPTGKSIKMLENEGYTVSNGAVYFSAAIPAGIVVSFDEPEDVSSTEGSLNYVVIYNDGRITEVAEDPAEYLAQTQKMLAEAQKHYAEVQEYSEQAVKRVMSLKESLADDFEEKLYDYTTSAKTLLNDTASLLTGKIHEELAAALLQISREAQTVETGLQIMELTKKEAQKSASDAAEDTKRELMSECQEILAAYAEMQKLRKDCQYYAEEAESAAKNAGFEVQSVMNHKAEEELEMLRSLRLRLESDSESLNKRINSAWEVLRGEINGK